MHSIWYINGTYLEAELEIERDWRHRIVHESERVDYVHPGPILRVMETMSWIHGWLLGKNGKFDPTESVWHSINREMKEVFPFEPNVDSNGIQVLMPFQHLIVEEDEFVHNIQIKGILEKSTHGKTDPRFCAMQVFLYSGYRFIEGKHEDLFADFHEIGWMQDGLSLRPIFFAQTDIHFDKELLARISTRLLALLQNTRGMGGAIFVVDHLCDVPAERKPEMEFVPTSEEALLHRLGITAVSFVDWVTFSILFIQCPGRDFGFFKCLEDPGVVRPFEAQLSRVGCVRYIFPSVKVISISMSTDSEILHVGDELVFRSGIECRVATVLSMQLKKTPTIVAFPNEVIGITVDSNFQFIKKEATVFKIRKPLLELNQSVTRKIRLKALKRRQLGPALPVLRTAFGTYHHDENLG